MRVAVIGGGVIGLSVAWRLAAASHDVDLFDDHPGAGASHAAAGMLAPAGESWFGEDDLIRLGAESLRMWPRFAADVSQAADLDVWLRREGTLLLGVDDADAADLDRVQGLLDRHELASERLARREARRLEPATATSVRRAILVRSDHSVHNRRLVQALHRACTRAGAHLHPERADVVVEEPGVATGVRGRDSGTAQPADVVVVAAGHALRHVAGVPEVVRRAVRPVKGQILRLRGDEPLLTRTVRARVRGEGVYAVPRADGEIVVGATSEEQGEDLRVTADGVFEVLRRAISVVPGLRECELTEAIARARPGTADNGPVIGRTDVTNLVVAGGHHRGGVLLAPVTAEAVAALLDGNEMPGCAAPFVPDRFGPIHAHRDRQRSVTGGTR